MVVFRNFQWGAEKRNTTLSFGAWESDGLVSPLAVWRSGGLELVPHTTQPI
jgi:hypothetical protein